MRGWLATVALATALAGCGANATSPSGVATAPRSPSAAASSGSPTPGGPAFATLAEAHSYAAKQGAAHFKAVVVSEGKQCPQQEGAGCYIQGTNEHQGKDAAYFVDDLFFNPTGAADAVYLYRDSAGWHWMDSLGTQNTYPSMGPANVLVDRGCADVHAATSTNSAVVVCLKDGDPVTIDGGPTYADGHIWWHLADRKGWIEHYNLISHFAPQTQT